MNLTERKATMEHPKKMSMEEFFKKTFSEDFLNEAEVEYRRAQIAGLAKEGCVGNIWEEHLGRVKK